jgi:porin
MRNWLAAGIVTLLGLPGTAHAQMAIANAPASAAPPDQPVEPAPLAGSSAPFHWLFDHGVLVNSAFYDDLQGNPVGGLKHGTANAGAGTIGADADLEKVVGIKGGRFHLLFTYEYGDTLQKDIGNFIKSQDWYLPFQKFQLAQLAYEQSLFGGALNVLGGRISAATIFARPTFGCQFISGSQCPYDLPVFTGGFSGFPYATWGGRLKINPTAKIYLQSGVFSADPNRKNLHGFDFTLKTATGVVAPVEIGYESDFSNDRYPRHYKVGAWYNNAPYADPLLNKQHQSRALFGGAPLTHTSDRGGVYALFDQAIYRPDESHRALYILGSFAMPFDRRELFSFQNTLGAYYTGPFAAHPHDSAGIMVTQLILSRAETQFLNDLLRKNGSRTFVNRNQYNVEINYGFRLVPGVTVSPNAEYIVNPDTTQRPDARFAPRDALVLGVRLTLNFDDLVGLPAALPRHG